MDANGNPVAVPLTRERQFLQSSFLAPYMSITPGSSFAAHFRNAMLLPPSDTHPTFRLLAGMTDDPSQNCYEGTIGYAQMPQDAIRLSVRVSVIPATGRTIVTRETNQLNGQRTTFSVTTCRHGSVIPYEIYEIWHEELMNIAGVENRAALRGIDWSPFLHLLPSIEFTVYRSTDSDEIVARIVLEARDFVNVLPLHADVMLTTSFYDSQFAFGLSTLKYMGIHFDYENSRIGFCEPI